jgi:ADP-ribose pyrophosphatase
MNSLTEKTLQVEEVFSGRVFKVEVHQVLLPDERIARREIVRHNGGACVLALDDEGQIYLVRQYRKPLEAELLEIPAGKLEAGEEPIECAKRELLEETGLQAENLASLAILYPSPGYTSEVLTIYLATGLIKGPASLDEGEYLVLQRMPLADALSMLDRGEIRDAKTQVALLALARKMNLKASVPNGNHIPGGDSI